MYVLGSCSCSKVELHADSTAMIDGVKGSHSRLLGVKVFMSYRISFMGHRVGVLYDKKSY